MTNRYPGSCRLCRASVAAAAGQAVQVGGRWQVACAACHGPARAETGTPGIEVTGGGDGHLTIRPTGYLGPALWESYRRVVDGARYDAGHKVSRCAPDLAATILGRATHAGFPVVVDDAARALLQTAQDAQGAAISAGAVRAQEVADRLSQRGLALYPYQAAGISWLAAQQSAILADDMGLGKTIQALTAAPVGAPILVICPAVAKGVWVREARAWRPDLTPVALSGHGSFRWPVAGEMVAINYDVLPDECGTPPTGCVLIADEAHAVKSGKSQRTERFRAISRAVREAGGRAWLITGTPLLNRPPELWALLTAIGAQKQAFGSWPKFVAALGGSEGRFGVEWGGAIDQRLVADRLREVMLRRLKSEVLTDLPAKSVEILDVEIDAKSIKQLDRIMVEFAASGIDLEAATKAAEENQSVEFATLARARAILAIAKAASAMPLLDELAEAGEPMVVFSAHRAPVDLLGARDGWATITGDTPPAERTAIEERFQRGELVGVAGTIQAMGVAITLTRASRAIMIDAAWTPALNAQAEDRIYRIGQSRAVQITYLRANHAIDERVFDLLRIKKSLIARTVDAAKGDGSISTITIPDASDVIAPSDIAARIVARIAEEAAEYEHNEKASKVERSAIARGVDIAEEEFRSARRAARDAREAWILDAMRSLSGSDGDRAQLRNDAGFSQADTGIGNALAGMREWTDGEWKFAAMMVAKYHRQVGRFGE